MRFSLFPDDVRPLQLHRAEGPLATAIDRCRERDWTVIELDAGRWIDDEQLHDDLDAALAFPPHYGRNLDALADQLQELAQATDSLAAGPGLAMVIRRIDQLMAADARRALTILEIIAEGALWSLRYGWPVAVLLQTDDPLIDLPPMAATSVEWNRSERRRADRA